MENNKKIGSHVSISGGVSNAPINAKLLNSKAFAMFAKNQKQWAAKPLTDSEIALFKKELEKAKISPDCVLPHDSYLINLGHPDSEQRQKSLDSFIEEMNRCDQLGLTLLNFHPGRHLKEITEEKCVEYVAESINTAISKTKNVKAIIETTAGQGSNIGFKFEQIAKIIELTEDKTRVGVCIDTCHIFSAGYDLRTEDTYKKTMDDFEKIIGFKYLFGVHLNDSEGDFGKKLDRHAEIGKGLIGLNCFKFIMNDKRFDNIPMVLETPNEDNWAAEIKMLYSLIEK